MPPAQLCLNHLATNCRRRFLPAAVPCAVWAVNVVVTRDACLKAKVLPEMAAHPLAEELLPTIAVFGQRGISILFLESRIVGVFLLISVVDTGGGRIEVLLDTVIPGGLEHMRIDENRQHAERLVVFDETHATHVRGKIIDLIGVPADRFTLILQVEVQHQVLNIVKPQIPFIERLDINCANLRESLVTKI